MSDETQVIDILKETCRNLNAGKIVFAMGAQRGFELEREVGKGGMGVVWLARDLDVEGRVALKFLPGLVRDPVAERDLRDEVKNARDLVHENIVSVRRLHKDEASIAVEMEFVDGPSVSRLIADSPNCWLEVPKASTVVRGLCLAIDYASKPPHNLVHRDIKPLNLLLNSAGVAKVVDFGIAHSVSETVARLTNVNAAKVVGSLPYMSPQQLKGEIHPLNDVYSIGATIYELLTGTAPFRARDFATLTNQINHDTPPTMMERRAQITAEKNRKVVEATPIPKGWEQVVAACLAKDPAKRPQGAREVARQLGLVSASSVTVAPFAPGPHGIRPRAKWQLPAAVAAVVLLGAGAGVWVLRDRLFPARTPSADEGRTSAPAATSVANAGKPTTADSTTTAEEPRAPAKPAATSTTGPEAAPRQNWELVATLPTRVAISDSTGKPLFSGAMQPGEHRAIPALDQEVLVELKEGSGLQLQVDGVPKPLPAVASNRWTVQVPASRAAAEAVQEAPPPPPPFEAEVGPLVKAGEITTTETQWLRDALGGAKGDQEQALARQLVAKEDPITVFQWRARTSFDYTPTAAVLGSLGANAVPALDIVLAPGTEKMRLLRINPGTYQKGSPPSERGHTPGEATATVRITKPFFIGIHEVTNRQFASVMKRSPAYFSRNPDGPVEQVRWNDLVGASGFITRLNGTLRKTADDLLEASLPTDDEWEYACRAGTITAYNNGRDVDADGSDLEKIACFNRTNGPKSVGLLAPNAWGLSDMHGNVQELTQDAKGAYARGGSWHSSAVGCRAAARVAFDRESPGNEQTGFRLVIRLHDQAQAR